MMLDKLKKEVYEANLLLPKYGLVSFTWGNVSGVDRESGLMVIKPSGVEYEKLTPGEMSVVELSTGRTVGGGLKPSSDTPAHLELYKNFPQIGGAAHTHSRWATAFAQARRGIPALGTTHADHFRGEVPCTRELTETDIKNDYEAAAGRIIAERFAELGLDPLEIPAALASSHGTFTWGGNAREAAINSAVLEIVAEMAFYTLTLSAAEPISDVLLDKHFFRKHGGGAYYGQIL